MQAAAEQAVAAGLKRLNTRGLEAALVAIDPQTGNILAMVGGADYARSTFNRATRSKRQPGSAFKPIRLRGGAVARLLAGLGADGSGERCPRPAIRNGCRRMPATKSRTALTLRAALVESNNAAAAELQQQGDVRRRAAGWRRMPGSQELPDVPSLALGSGEVTPLELTAAFTRVSRRRPAGRRRTAMSSVADAGRHRGVHAAGRSASRSSPSRSPFRWSACCATSSIAERRALRAPSASRGPVAREDRHDRRLSRRVVRRFLELGRRRRLGRLRSAGAHRTRRVRRARRRADLGGLHEADRHGAAGVRASGASGARDRRAVQRVATCGRLTAVRPTSEYFKDGDAIPSAHCAIHQGSFKQRAQRAVDGFFRSLGGRIAGCFAARKKAKPSAPVSFIFLERRAGRACRARAGGVTAARYIRSALRSSISSGVGFGVRSSYSSRAIAFATCRSARPRGRRAAACARTAGRSRFHRRRATVRCGLGGLPVHVDLPALAGLLRFGPRPEQAGDIEPDVEANSGDGHDWNHPRSTHGGRTSMI